MYIARILYPVSVLGPGKRIGIWFCGCKHHCKGCSNPELWEPLEKYRTGITTVMHLIMHIAKNNPVDGFTLTGGDPFEQPRALEELLPLLSEISTDILAYTGFDFEFVRDSYPQLLAYLSVVIDGKYIEERNTGLSLRGSDNQRIIILNEQYEKLYSEYLSETTAEIQNFATNDGIISVGIHLPGYEKDLDERLKQKGLRKNE